MTSKDSSYNIDLARKRSVLNNINSEYGFSVISKMISPSNSKSFVHCDKGLKDSNGKLVPIKNGIPDLTIYSDSAWDEKQKQADYHDNEDLNETFEEIVLRPYNHSEFFAKIWVKHLEKLVNRVESLSGKPFSTYSILNCGCGGGFEAQYFAEQNAEVTGFDISQLRVEAAATRFALNNLEGFFYRGDASILPFPDDSFDIVVYHDSLHHVPIEEIPIAIKEARRVAQKLVVLSEAHDSPIRMLLESMGKSISIEESGNYTFRFKKSLIQFWCHRFGMKLLLYETSFDRKEHRPKIYGIPYIGPAFYHILKFFGMFLAPLGNEALIIMKKIDR